MNQSLGGAGNNNLINISGQESSIIDSLKIRFFYSKLFWIILAIKLIATFFAYFIYSKFTPFVDAAYYLSSCSGYCFLGSHRTTIAHILFYSLKSIFIKDLAVNIFVSFLTSYVLWYVFKRSYKFLNKSLFYSALCLPHFLIWSGVVGKDILLIASFLLVISSCVDLTIRNKIKFFPLMIGLIIPLIIRPQFLLPYGYLLLITFFLINLKNKFLDTPKNSTITLILITSFVFILFFIFWDSISIYLLKLMKHIKFDYFLSQTSARTTRLNIIWENTGDFIFNLWWGVPISIIGPTLHEAFIRPILFPALLEGLFSLGLFVYLIVKTIKFSIDNPKYNSFIILGFIPAVLIGLTINYPMGIFNPGSAIRYKQTLAPLFYFYPLLLMSEIKMNNFLNR